MSSAIEGRGHGVTLRGTLRAAILLLAAFLLATATALSVVTTLLHRTTEGAVEAVESVRIAEALEVELMTHRRALNLAVVSRLPPSVRPGGPSSARLERLLVEADRYAATDREHALVARADATVTAYLEAARKAEPSAGEAPVKLEAEFDAAFVALDALVWFNVDDAHALNARAARWDWLSDVMSVVVGALALGGVVALLAGLRSQMVRAIGDLHAAVCGFMGGDAGARAPERGAREVRDLARSFNQMAATLVRQEHDRLRFLSGLAQDLRDPLTVIKLLTQPVLPADAACGPAIERQIQRMERILRDVVDGALIASGRVDLKLAPRDLREPVLSAVDAYRTQAPDHRFDVDVPERPVMVCCDAARIEHTLNNLLSNAAKYSQSGSRVSVRPCARRTGARSSTSPTRGSG